MQQPEKYNLWDQINGVSEPEPIQEPEPTPEPPTPAAEEPPAEQPAPAHKKKKTTLCWLIPAVAAVLVLSIGLTLFFTRPKPPAPQPEELVTLWLCTERCYYNAQSGLEEKNLRTYDENGNVLTYAVYMGERETNRLENTYDEENRLLETATYSNGQESYRYQYTWDFQGNQTKSVEIIQGKRNTEYTYIFGWKGELLTQLQTDPGGKRIQTDYVYDSRGNVIRKSVKTGSVVEWRNESRYDEKNRLILEEFYYNGMVQSTHVISYNPDGTVAMRQNQVGDSVQHQLYFYDENGNQTEQIFYEDGKYVSTVTRDYDQAGNLIGQVSHDGEKELYRYSYNYDIYGRKTEAAYRDDQMWHIETWFYNEDGTLRRYESGITDQRGSHTSWRDYTYDEHGNCIEVVSQQVDGKTYRSTKSYVEVKVTAQRAEELQKEQSYQSLGYPTLYSGYLSSQIS